MWRGEGQRTAKVAGLSPQQSLRPLRPHPVCWGPPPSSVRGVWASQAPALLRLSSLPVPARGRCEAPGHTAGDSVRGNNLPTDLPRRVGGAPHQVCVGGGGSCSSEWVASLDGGPGTRVMCQGHRHRRELIRGPHLRDPNLYEVFIHSRDYSFIHSKDSFSGRCLPGALLGPGVPP